MKQTKIIMGMPICVEIIDDVDESYLIETFNFFEQVDERYSPYKDASLIAKINNRLISEDDYDNELNEIMTLCEQTKQATNGYFDIRFNHKIDPSGLVKGWSINVAANKLKDRGVNNFYIEAGGDIQVYGLSDSRQSWNVGIRNPFNVHEIVKSVKLDNQAIATSGNYLRGNHIYNPITQKPCASRIVSLSVIGPNILDADRYATAAYAMEDKGIYFIDALDGFEAYQINEDGIGSMTRGFEQYVA